MVTPTRLLSDGKIESQEKTFVDECNDVKHKLVVTKYLSGDDRDNWYLKCTQYNASIDYHFSWDQPFLNYCPYCSTAAELAAFEQNGDFDNFETDAYTGRQIPCVEYAPYIPKYIKKL